jgi:protocatechuate 3,4-dioxygenase beta subunit
MVVEVEESPLKEVQGVLKGEDGAPISNALVEVFTHPEYLLSKLPNDLLDHPEQQRIAVCLTSNDGKFCFRSLPAAAYEIRSSVSNGWDVTHVHVTVDPKKGKTKKLVVHMQIGK